MTLQRLVCSLIAALLLLSVRVSLHVGGYWEWTRLLRLENSHPTLVRRLWLNSFERSVERVPRSVFGLAVIWIRVSTIVIGLLFLLGALVFAVCAVAPDFAA